TLLVLPVSDLMDQPLSQVDPAAVESFALSVSPALALQAGMALILAVITRAGPPAPPRPPTTTRSGAPSAFRSRPPYPAVSLPTRFGPARAERHVVNWTGNLRLNR